MKKTFALLLSLCLVFSLCGCGALDAIRSAELPPLPTPDAPATPEPAAETPESAQPLPAAEPAPAFAQTGAELGERVTIFFNQTKESEYAPDDETRPILVFSYVTPSVRMESKPDAAEEINEQLRLLDELYYSGYGSDAGKNQLYEIALDNFGHAKATGVKLGTVFSSARTVKNTRADGSVISFRYWKSVYTGGTSSVHSYTCYNFDSQSGKKLTLDDLSADPAALRSALVENLIAFAKESGLYAQIAGSELDPDSALAAVVREESWLFSAAGMEFYPAFGELLPEEEGAEYPYPILTVPYARIAGLIDDRFLPAAREGDGEFSLARLDEVENGSVWIVDRVAVSEGEELCLSVNGTVYDVTLSSFYYLDQMEEEERFVESARHWYSSYMKDCALQICTLVPDGMPDLMVSYTDSAQVPHRLFISQSGADGGVTLADESIRAVG